MEAGNILKMLLRDYGNKLAVRLLQLDVVSKEENPNSESYHAALDAISKMVHLTEQNFSMVLHFVHQLREYSPELSTRFLERFLLQRLVPHGHEEWITKAFITLLWMSTTRPVPCPSPSELWRLLTDLYTGWNKCLCQEATHGALLLLWKRIEDNFEQGRFQDTVEWCELAQHKLLQKAGDIIADKIERKLAQCYLETEDLEACKAHISRLLDSKDRNPLNQYLAYCLALKRKDTESAREALAIFDTATNTTSEQLLHACISKTLEDGMAEQTADVLLILLNKPDVDFSKHINLLPLLRQAPPQMCALGTKRH